MKILLAADRSAGHIFPALTLAENLSGENGDKVYLFLTSEVFKRKIKHRPGISVLGRPLRTRNLFLELLFRFGEAVFLLIRIRPDKIIGFGGRGGFFLVLLGSILRADTYLYEPNVIMGRANAALKFFVKKVFYGFSADRSATVVGIPLHSGIKRRDRTAAREIIGLAPDKPVVFCFGGSQGAGFINRAFKDLVEDSNGGFQPVHITGARDYYYFAGFYDKIMRAGYFVKDFSADIGLLYSSADVVICRAGALTCSEISYFGIPALFLPYPGAGLHQEKNASFFADKKAAFMLKQSEFSKEKFSGLVKELLNNAEVRRGMEEALGHLKVWAHGKEFSGKVLSRIRKIQNKRAL